MCLGRSSVEQLGSAAEALEGSPPSMDEENYSPSEVANVPAYYALNPSLFDSAEHWTYRDLQKLVDPGVSTPGIPGQRSAVIWRSAMRRAVGPSVITPGNSWIL